MHKADVVDAATAILDAHGIADLTMRRVARELNVTPGALYWHFASKQELLGAVADRILRPAVDAEPAGDWGRRIEATCLALRDALNHYLVHLIEIPPVQGGTSYWVTGPESLDVRGLQAAAEARGILIQPASHFYSGRAAPRNVGLPSAPRTVTSLEKKPVKS